jgi:hypothetical protein
MEHFEPERLDPEIDAFLRNNRPVLDRDWVRNTERRLFDATSRRAPIWRLAQIRPAVVVAAGIVALLLVLALAGVGPLVRDRGDVRAKDDCSLIEVTRLERVPHVVEGAGGDLRIVYRRERVQRVERRCR